MTIRKTMTALSAVAAYALLCGTPVVYAGAGTSCYTNPNHSWCGAGASDEVKGLIAAEGMLDEECRGGSLNDAMTGYACRARQTIGVVLDKNGWCYGKKDESPPLMRWHRCTTDSVRGAP